MAPSSVERSVRLRAREALLAWFRTNGPEYPWRRVEGEPYAVLVSEVMLQQTQASRVAEAFPRFLDRFPDLVTLARSSGADVIHAWSGLGYNRRAVALHRASRVIVEKHGGKVPRDLPSLLSLPGVGPYTAAAVASIAFGAPVAAVDTNIRKVMARLAFGLEFDEASAAAIAHAAEDWLVRDAPGDWNQAVMNLGREICRPTPRCESCPMSPACRFRARGRRGRRSARAQPVFEGSRRQVRGNVVHELSTRVRAASVDAVAEAIGMPVARVVEAVESLERDGIVQRIPSGRVRLPR
jgi:A/G-specific adenine glycosylase